MMKGQFPDQKGFQETVVLEGAQAWDDVPQRFTQIVFDQSQKHWVCVSNKFTDGIVEIYDSLLTDMCSIKECNEAGGHNVEDTREFFQTQVSQIQSNSGTAN